MPRKKKNQFNRLFVLAPDATIKPENVTTDLVSVTSFNMLADSIHLRGQPREEYDRWAARWPVLEQELLRLNTDIVCLQEVDEVR